MQIEILGSKRYRLPLGPAPDGVTEGTHTALVKFSDGIERRAVVKIYPQQIHVVNEVIGHALAHAAGHHTPRHAAMIYVPVKRLPKPLPRWLEIAGTDEWPAWCAELVPRDSLKMFYQGNLKPVRRELAASKQTPRIAALDSWMGNVDRNIGNLLRLSEGRYSLIDHGQILGNIDWMATRPDPTAVYRNKITDWLAKEAETLPFKSAAAHAAGGHADALRQAHSTLDRWWSILDADAAGGVQHFLNERARTDRVKERLGLLA